MTELLIKAPPALMPVPLSVNALVLAIAVPLRSNTAPLVTETAEAEVPKAVKLPTLNVPAPIVMPPLKVFAPESKTVPVLPVLPIVKTPEPLTTPEMASVAPVPADNIPPPACSTILVVVAGPFEEPLVAEFVKVPLLMVTVAVL